MAQNLVEIIIGFIGIIYGIVIIVVRITAPEKLQKMTTMKKVYGAIPGIIIHIILYSLIPIAIGVFLVASGLQGKSIF